jgi:hypothetical protein
MAGSSVSGSVLTRARFGPVLAIAIVASGCVAAPAVSRSSEQAPTGSSAEAKTAAPNPTGSPAARSPAIIPWVDRPVPAYVEPAPKPYPTDARVCTPGDLKVSAGDIGAGLGNINLPVTFVNHSPSACVLNGEPTITGVETDGRLVPLRANSGSYFGDPGPPANIAKGEAAALNISGADACPDALAGRHRVYARLRIGLPGGGSVDVAARDFDAVCGVSVSRFGVPADVEPAVDPAVSPLTAEIVAPGTVVAGKVLVYTVTLTNPTATDVSLSPCPAYDESVGSGSDNVWAATVLHYSLNCDAFPTIAAGTSMTYAMRLALPPGQPPGMAKFVWDIQGNAGPFAIAPLTVTAAP